MHEDFLVTYRLGERARFTDVLIRDQITPGTEIALEHTWTPLRAASAGVTQNVTASLVSAPVGA